MTEKRGIDTLYTEAGKKVKLTEDSEWGGYFFDIANNKKRFMEFARITHMADSKEEAQGKLDNPTRIFGNIFLPYCILFQDNSGDSPLRGGMTCVFGYQYASDSYGAQIAIGFNGWLKFRRKFKDVWSDWETIFTV